MVVPRLRAAGSRRSVELPATRIRPPTSSSSVRLSTEQRLTEAMLARASPRKPKDAIWVMSAAETIFEVACRSRARGSSR